MKKKLNIITGSSGYIGKGLTKEFSKRKINFIGIDKLPRNDKFTVKLDLKNKKKTLNFFNKYICDEIFHFGTFSAAAYKEDFETCFREDLISLQNLLSSLKEYKKKPKLVYMSSSYVYSGLKIRPKGTNEILDLKPEHDFGFAKKFFEDYLTKYYPNSTIFRLSNVFGEGEFIRGNTVYNMAYEAKKNNDVTIWGKGNRKIQYLYIGDLMKYLVLKKKLNGIFNLGGNEYIKISTLTKMLCDFFGSNATFLKNKKEGETLAFMNTSKIKNEMQNYFTNFENNLTIYLKNLDDRF